MNAVFAEADVIYAYTRAQALEAGELADVSKLAAEMGFRCPVAVTSAVWEGCCNWTAEDTKRKSVPQDITGRTWDVLWMLWNAIKRAGAVDQVTFSVYRVPREGRGRRARLVQLKAVMGPGDNGEAVITIMEPSED